MNLLFLVMHLAFMMEALWHNSLLAKILWYVMLMGSGVRNNLSTHSMITSRQITDGGKYEFSKKVADPLRSLFIKQYESEPYHQHQNKAE